MCQKVLCNKNNAQKKNEIILSTPVQTYDDTVTREFFLDI